MLTILLGVPAMGAGVLLLLPGLGIGCSRRLAMMFALATLGVALLLTATFDTSNGGLQFVERVAWVPGLGVEWSLGIDGLGLMLVLLAGIVTPLALALPAPGEEHETRGQEAGSRQPSALAPSRLYFSMMLLLEAMALGVFVAQNFIPFFLFWELSLVPSFLLIKLWGGRWRSEAALQFFLLTLAGGLAMLAGFVGLHLGTGTFEFAGMMRAAGEAGGAGEVMAARLGGDATAYGLLTFWLVFAGLAVKVPVMPLHTWLPGAYAEAPSGATMMLTGLLSKMGVYGMLRFLWPLFPGEMRAMAPVLLVLAVATVVIPTFAALAQRDLKRMLAYSSINHLGYCLLAIFAVAATLPGGVPGTEAGGQVSASWKVSAEAALAGAMLQLFNHGLTAATLFGCVGLIEARSGGLRGIDEFGGLRAAAPALAGVMGVALFASLGLPGLNGFVGEFLVFRGVLGLVPWAAVVSLPALLLTAVFLLRIIARVFSGPLPERWKGFPDLTWREKLVFAPAVVLMIVLGFFPSVLLNLANATVLAMLEGRQP